MKLGPCIITKVLLPTDTKDARVKATYKRDSSTTWSKTVAWNTDIEDYENHYKAAKLLIDTWPLNEEHTWSFIARGHDQFHYYFVATYE